MRKKPNKVYNSGRNWMMRMLPRSGIEKGTLKCGVCVARRQY